MSIKSVLIAAILSVFVAATNVYDFVLKTSNNEDYPLSKYDHTPVIMVVNVASECGFTDVNYKELQSVYEEFHEFGFDIIAVPCNQFGAQEPGTYEDILHFAKENYKTTFNIFQKEDVNGPNTHPLFKWLKDKIGGGDVAWNFEKFLIVDGQPWKRFPHTKSPRDIEDDILYALAHESDFHREDYEDVHDEL